MNLFRALWLTSTFTVATMASAAAGTLTAEEILADYNAVIYTNATTTSDVEGAIVVGGNFSGATLYNHPASAVAQPALTVYGNTSGNSININDGGSVYVAGTKGAQVNFNGGGKYISTSPATSITAFEAPLSALSLALSKLTATSVLADPTNNEVITATPGANGIAVLNITAAQLALIPSFKIALNGASTFVINVDGSTAIDNANDQSGTSGANNIIWNFFDATGTVALNTQIIGTVLAPGALVTNGNQIDGVLIARAWTGNGELHDYAFDGDLPATTATPVPEPMTAAILSAGMIGIGMIRRRR